MSSIRVKGIGAVSPAGWGMAALRSAIGQGLPLPLQEIERLGWPDRVKVRRVPAAQPRPSFLAHPRLRRTSPISQFATGAALEALGEDAANAARGEMRIGIVLCVMTGCVNYSRRFYDEVLRQPETASPLIFPETVFNAPSSHIAALLGISAINYTLIGDPGVFLHGLVTAADWIQDGRVDGCVVIGAEELDWLTADAFQHFNRNVILSEGAAAVHLGNGGGDQFPVSLDSVTSSHLYLKRQSRVQAAAKMRSEMPRGGNGAILCDGLAGAPRFDAAERSAWQDWTGSRFSVKQTLGEGLTAAAGWQCVFGIDALCEGDHSAAMISVVGCNQQAIGAVFSRTNSA